MRTIHVNEIIETVEKLCMHSNYYLNDDILEGFKNALVNEESQRGIDILEKLIENAKLAREKEMAICQDTGMAVVFLDIGQDVRIVGGNLEEAINEGVRRGYEKGFLRKSVVEDPIKRNNTNDNTPAVIHYNIIEGDKIKISIAPKGFGSENMSRLKMLKPSDGEEGIKKFIIDTVDKAGPNPCPPVVVGVGIGGTMEKAAVLAKKALIRPINKRSHLEHIRKIEEEVLDRINLLGIGPAGLGGTVTALAVNIEVFPTHIAGLPVAVNISCHATRHGEAVI
ncbi:MAG TPA: fumarate hydratase [Ruminiclostridium sp.]|jgi:fumarate hydratase subunit alpha|uniref:Fumarate hydratase n=1 Tax=Acetivibrio saccincola TaxID=1677857 RepID=A0A2K9ERY1_9FIRM|nr:fumarate hydratase [Acetivibrio saccincola]HAA43673.1 fumarate hydratase [Ruminiclostridium sp.]AUG58300.1 L(+)-tartrate dehydratase subunit alpha [Acetivibrio saccincola]NLW27931.1 fumarate hydratase [Acetivibrio saccincola]PQQ68181.1 fumarate hydratase [Acetivibrio saccincola]HOA97475.1 fumarate hydratase [Acetivibrio saccincola]